VIQFAEAVERRVLSAYGFLVANPSLGAHASLVTQDKNGYIRKWLEEWGVYKHDADLGRWAMFHARAGYAIESLATFLALQDAPAGTYARPQVEKGGTRPDLVLYEDKTNRELCWLDITAGLSKGHVEKKIGNWLQPHNAEILYPSFTDSDFTEMKANDPKLDKPREMSGDVRWLLATGITRNRIEEEEQNLRRQYFRDNDVAELDEKLLETPLTASQKRALVVSLLKTKYSELTEKPVAHMLYAAGLSVAKYLPETNTKKVPEVSKREGHRWLARYATALSWPGVTLPDARKAEIRRDVEEELFKTSGRTLEAAVDLEAGQKRKREEEPALRALRRRGSF